MKRENVIINFLLFVFFLCLLVVVGSYVLNFKGFSISKDPSSWGVLGDYFGGILNPLISLMTLFFLIKTYLSQKAELQQSEIAAQEQRAISLQMAQIQFLQTKISASYDLIAVYRQEIDGVTKAMNAPGDGLSYYGVDGKVYFAEFAQKNYRSQLIKNIDAELKKIHRYLKELES